MPRYRKKPIVIEARQVTEDNFDEICEWCEAEAFDSAGIYIVTLEGTMTAAVGDWIIRGVKGEFYPCKSDIFAATYEPAD